MFKRRWVRWAIGAALVLLALSAWLVVVRRGLLTPADCERVREGMTLPEVEPVFGNRKAVLTWGDVKHGTRVGYVWPAEGQLMIEVEFRNGRVAAPARMGYLGGPLEPETLRDRVRAWLGW
jgi:hypothetical protein